MPAQLQMSSSSVPTCILAFLAEQKVASISQLHTYCANEVTYRYVAQVLQKFVEHGFVQKKTISVNRQKPYGFLSITDLGLKELKFQSDMELEKIQIKSNYPVHDYHLSSIRCIFSKIKECDCFISESVLQTKLLEQDILDLVLYRALRVDAVVRLTIGGRRAWIPLEFERGHKGTTRYVDRIKKVYQTDALDVVLVVAETKQLNRNLIDIEKTVYPNSKRKMLFSDLESVLNATSQIQFASSFGDTLVLNVGSLINTKYPLIDQTFTQAWSSSSSAEFSPESSK